MPGAIQTSGLHERRPEDLRKELMDLVIANRKVFAGKEYNATIKALIQMKPEQYAGFKKRITEQIEFRRKHNVTNAGTARLF